MKVPARLKEGIARYRPDDADDLADFQLANFGPAPARSTRRDVWLFDRNPCRSEGDGRDMWVCRRDGVIVGQQAEIPFDLHVATSDHRAAWGIDLMVDDAWRMRGVGPALVATQLDHRPIVVRAQHVRQGLHALRARAASSTWGSSRCTCGRSTCAGRSASVGSRGWCSVPPRCSGRCCAPPTRPAWRRCGPGVRLEPVDRFDERVDDVWKA